MGASLPSRTSTPIDGGRPVRHQKLQVCDVCGAYLNRLDNDRTASGVLTGLCGAYLSRLDNDRRLADHFYGKMHLGYAQMHKSYESLQKELKMVPSTRCVNCK